MCPLLVDFVYTIRQWRNRRAFGRGQVVADAAFVVVDNDVGKWQFIAANR